MNTNIDAVRHYLEWAEVERLNGNTSPTIEQYEETLRVSDLEARMTAIQDILDSTDSAEDKIFLITTIIYPVGGTL